MQYSTGLSVEVAAPVSVLRPSLRRSRVCSGLPRSDIHTTLSALSQRAILLAELPPHPRDERKSLLQTSWLQGSFFRSQCHPLPRLKTCSGVCRARQPMAASLSPTSATPRAPYWRASLGKKRCIVPFPSFCEYADTIPAQAPEEPPRESSARTKGLTAAALRHSINHRRAAAARTRPCPRRAASTRLLTSSFFEQRRNIVLDSLIAEGGFVADFLVAEAAGEMLIEDLLFSGCKGRERCGVDCRLTASPMRRAARRGEASELTFVHSADALDEFGPRGALEHVAGYPGP